MEELRLEFDLPLHGWIPVHLASRGTNLNFAASYTPRDTIGDLVQAIVGMMDGDAVQTVVWNTEPIEYEFRFLTGLGQTEFSVHKFPGTRRWRNHPDNAMVLIEGETAAIAYRMWLGVRRLQDRMPAEEFAVAWRYPFPSKMVERLGVQHFGAALRSDAGLS